MKVLVGSAAVAMHTSDFRVAKDYDYFSNEELPNDINGIRVEKFWHSDLEKINWQHDWFASMDELYTIKVSHMFWDNRWVKHAKDVIWFQKQGCTFIPEMYDVLYPIWVEHYGAKRTRLPRGTKAEDFFNAAVDRKYEHDSIHASVAYYGAPLFESILADGEAVAVDWQKFEALSDLDKLRLVREEVYATALERRVIPSDYTVSGLSAYRYALQKTITSFWKGKWALYAALNLKDLVVPEVDYVRTHLDNKERLILL